MEIPAVDLQHKLADRFVMGAQVGKRGKTGFPFRIERIPRTYFFSDPMRKRNEPFHAAGNLSEKFPEPFPAIPKNGEDSEPDD